MEGGRMECGLLAAAASTAAGSLSHTWFLTGRKLHALIRQPWVLAFSVAQQAIASRNPLNWEVQIGRAALSASPDWPGIALRCGGLLPLAIG